MLVRLVRNVILLQCRKTRVIWGPEQDFVGHRDKVHKNWERPGKIGINGVPRNGTQFDCSEPFSLIDVISIHCHRIQSP